MTDSPLNGSRTRNAGAMEPLYWSPGSPIFEMTSEDALKLPQKVVWFGSTSGCPREVLKFIKPEIRNRDFVLFSNFELDVKLKTLLQRVVKETNCGEPGRAYDDEKLCELLDQQQECLSAFDACVQ